MFKQVQLKVILIEAIVGILAITALVTISILDLEMSAMVHKEEAEIIYNQIGKLQVTSGITITVYGIINILIALFMHKSVINPVDKMSSELSEKLNDVNEQKTQIENILLHLNDGVIAFDMKGEIININPAATELLKLSSEDNTFDKIFGKLKLDIDLEKTIFLENWTSNEQKVQVKDKFLDMFFASIKDDDDSPLGIMVVIQDVTEHEKLDNMRTEFVANVSHELKTPITSIMGYAETLIDGEYDKETEVRFINVILSEAQRMAKLVRDLLELSKNDTNEKELEITDFDIADVARHCQEQLQPSINKKKQECNVYETTNDIPLVHGDKDGIERVILNIMSNAVKYTEEGGHIDVFVRHFHNDVYVKIADNGIGIPEEDQKRIFERFYRVDKARSREMGGTGLGLSIAKEIVDQNGGQIDIKSKEGEGTEVTIRLPSVKSMKEEE